MRLDYSGTRVCSGGGVEVHYYAFSQFIKNDHRCGGTFLLYRTSVKKIDTIICVLIKYIL